MHTRARALVALLILILTAPLFPPSAASAAETSPRLELTMPETVRSGESTNLYAEIDNSEGAEDLSAHLRLTFTPVAGSATRSLASTLELKYLADRLRSMELETVGDSLVASTAIAWDIPAGALRRVSITLTELPLTLSAPHVDAASVSVLAEAVDSVGTVLATDPGPAPLTMYEPRTTLDWPARVSIGESFIATTTFTNTTPQEFVFTTPYLNLLGQGNDGVVVEMQDGSGWTTVQPPSDRQAWPYNGQMNVRLAPGEAFAAVLRITFNKDIDVEQAAVVQHVVVTVFGRIITGARREYTMVPRT
jgi:hypothetical protein